MVERQLSKEKSASQIHVKPRATEIFGARFADYIGVKHAIGTSLGRTALLVLLNSIGLKKEEEVIMPAYICEVVPNAVLKAGATPVFVDINSNNYHISLSHLKSLISEKTKAVIVNHIFGYPEDIDKIKELITNKDIYVIEDAAHALGARYRDKAVGNLGNAAFFSLTKNTFNVGGGVIATDDPVIASKAKRLLGNAKVAPFLTRLHIASASFLETRRVHSSFSNSTLNLLDSFPRRLGLITKGYYNSLKIPTGLAMSQREARLGTSALQKLDSLNEKRNRNKSTLDNLLKDTSGISLVASSSDISKHVCTWYAIRLTDPTRRDKVIKILARKRVFLYRFWDPIPIEYRRYNEKQTPADVPNAIRNANSTLVFKMAPHLSEKEVEKIGKALLSVTQGDVS